MREANALQWRHNDHDSVSNHQPRCCLLNRSFRRRSKKTSKLRVTDLCVGNSSGLVNSPYKGPVTRKMFPFDDVIMIRLPHVPMQQTNKNIVKYTTRIHYELLVWSLKREQTLPFAYFMRYIVSLFPPTGIHWFMLCHRQSFVTCLAYDCLWYLLLIKIAKLVFSLDHRWVNTSIPRCNVPII